MDLFVLFSLALDILPDGFFIPVPSDGVHVVPTGPDVSTPQHLLDLWVKSEQLFGSDAFCCFDDLGRRKNGNALNQKMDMILIGSDLHEVQFVALLNVETDVFQSCLHFFCEDFLSVFCRTDEMIEKEGHIVTLVNVLAIGHAESLPRFTSSFAL